MATTLAEFIEQYVFPPGSTVVHVDVNHVGGQPRKIFQVLPDLPFRGALPPRVTLETVKWMGTVAVPEWPELTELWYLTMTMNDYWSTKIGEVPDYGDTVELLQRIFKGGRPNADGTDFADYLTFKDDPKTAVIRDRLIRLYDLVNP